MRTDHRSILWILLLPWVLWQCKHTGGQVQNPTPRTQPSPTPPRVVALTGCVRGQLMDEEGKPVSYGEIRTEPPTILLTASKQGQFEICFKRIRSPDNPNSSVRAPLDLGSYGLFAVKENKKAGPVKFTYDGKEVELGQIKMASKVFSLQDSVQTGKPKERKVDGGVIGTNPKEE